MNWQSAVVVAARRETADSRTLVIQVDGGRGHLAGQHIDIRLTAPDGYSAVRSYSIASSAAASAGQPFEITVDRLDDGEVSPYLVDVLAVGEEVEVRGPAGRYFVWEPGPDPVQLIAGGSGIVPLMAMIRTHRDLASTAPFRLLYSVRAPELAIFRNELLESRPSDVDITWAFTRSAPDGWPTPPARVGASTLASATFAPEFGARTYVCGSTPFVESIANRLVDAGHDLAAIRTERYGG